MMDVLRFTASSYRSSLVTDESMMARMVSSVVRVEGEFPPALSKISFFVSFSYDDQIANGSIDQQRRFPEYMRNSIMVIKGNATDFVTLGRTIALSFRAFEPLNPRLQMRDYPLPRNDVYTACLYLDYSPARYSMFPPTCRQAAVNSSRTSNGKNHILSYDHFPIITRHAKGTCVYELSGHPTLTSAFLRS